MVPACIYPQLDPIRGVEHFKQRSGFGTAGVFSGDFLSSLGGHIELKNVAHKKLISFGTYKLIPYLHKNLFTIFHYIYNVAVFL